MRNRNPPFICIIGVDGVGKTTHVRKIIDRLQSSGMPCKYTWFRFQNYISLAILAYCKVTGLTVSETQCDKRVSLHQFYRSRSVSWLYPLVLFVDMLPAYFIKIRLPMLLGYAVVCDRCAYDTLVDLMIDLGNPEIHKEYVGRLFRRLIPKDARVALLDLDEEIIRSRRKELRDDHTLEMRRRLYHKLSQEFQIPVIDNDAEMSKVGDVICETLVGDVIHGTPLGKSVSRAV
jgi:thymidylate kinase